MISRVDPKLDSLALSPLTGNLTSSHRSGRAKLTAGPVRRKVALRAIRPS